MQKIRRGPKTKPLAERSVPEVLQIQRPIRTYSCAKKLQVLKFLSDHRVPCSQDSGSSRVGSQTLAMRPPSQAEACIKFQIPQTTISGWVRISSTILEASKNGRSVRQAGRCDWPEIEKELNERFLKEREAGRAVRRG